MDQNSPIGKKLLTDMNWAAVRAAEAALKVRERPDFHDQIRTKKDGTKRTPADVAAQELLQEELGELMPEATFIGEESMESGEMAIIPPIPPQYRWIVDPVDGTKSFIDGNRWAVSIALQEWEGETQRYETKAATIFCVDASSTSNNLDGTLYCSAEKPALQMIQVQDSRPEKAKKNYKPGGPVFKSVDTVEMGSVVHIGLFERDFLRRRIEPRPTGPRKPAQRSPEDDTALVRSRIMGLPELSQADVLRVSCICQAMMDLPAGKAFLYANGLHHEYDAAAGVFLLGRAGIPTVEYRSTSPDQSIVIASQNESLFKECVDILKSEKAIWSSTEILHAHNRPKNFELVELSTSTTSKPTRRK